MTLSGQLVTLLQQISWSGLCDSQVHTKFGQGKKAFLKKIEENDEIREISSIMCN